MKIIVSVFFVVIIEPIISVSQAQTIETFSTYQSIGVKVTSISGIDSCHIDYRKTTESNWKQAYNPDLIQVSGIDQFRGSIFLLEESSDYEIRGTVFSAGNSTVLPTVTSATLTSPSFASTSNVKWVSPNGTGDFSAGNPGSLTALFSIGGQVTCGTTIILTDGIYKQSGFQLNITSDCTENTPIIIMAAPGANPIVDGGVEITTNWTPHATITNLFSTPIPSNAQHSNICLLGNTALYPYSSLVSEVLLGGYNLSNLSFGYDGFVRDASTIWIKTQAGLNPNDSTVIVSSAFKFLTIYGNNKKAHLKVKGIVFQYFGKPVLNPIGSIQDYYGAAVFDIRNASNIVFDNCKFNYSTGNISFSGICNDFTIQNSNFKHDSGKWSHAMVKKSHDFVNNLFVSISTSRARGVENGAIFIDQGTIGTVRNCLFDGVNSGIVSYFETGFKEEIDINDNVFMDNFDAIENDGLCSNLRVWNNEIIRPMAAFSIAPPLIGPRFYYRNTVHGMQGRRNEQNDPNFIGCEPIVGQNYRSQGVGIKTNSGYTGSDTPGNLYFFNNTFHAQDTLGFVFSSWTDEWKNALFINNSYSNEMGYPFHYFDLADNLTNGDFQLTSKYENYYSFNAAMPIAVAKHIHGQFQCSEIMNVSMLESSLSNISTSSNIEIQNPTQNDPGFVNKNIGGFELENNSLMINAGVVIKGFYDYLGISPDIGAKENNGQNNINESKIELINIYPNPSKGEFHLRFDSSIQEIELEVYNLSGIKVFAHDNFKQIDSLDLSDFPNGIYLLSLKSKDLKSTYRLVKIGL